MRRSSIVALSLDARDPAVLTVRRTADDDVQDRQVYLSVDGEDWVTHWSGMLFMAFLGAAVLTVRLEREPTE